MIGDDNFSTAFQLHTWGYSVIPSGGGDSGKQPLVEWADYQTTQPTSEQMYDWNDTLSPPLWGIVTNSTMAVLDADTAEVRTELEIQLGNPHVSTPRGGGHWYINTSGHAFPTKTGILPGIDIRGEGGFVNIVGGEYQILTLPGPDTLIPLERVPERILCGLNNRKPPIENKEPIPERKRNSTLASIAGALRARGLNQAAMEATLLAINTAQCKPPLEDWEVQKIARSIATYPPNSGISNTLINNATTSSKIASKRDKLGTSSGQDADRRWGFLAKAFDEIVAGAGGPIDKREVAGTMGVQVTDDSFRKLLSRRMNVDHKVRSHRGSAYLIEWIRRDYKVTDLAKAEATPLLDVTIALDVHRFASIPEGSIMVVAGMTSSGKTSFLLETAELNVFAQSRPVYYWYNEMSERKMMLRCEDFPLLQKAQAQGKFFPVGQGDFEFRDVLIPNAVNLIDYVDRNDALYLIGDDLRKLYQVLTTGWVCVAIQKKANVDLGYGGGVSIKLANNYITLDIVKQTDRALRGKATIKKAKDWASDTNPNNLWCIYQTGGKHGKLFLHDEWGRSKSGG